MGLKIGSTDIAQVFVGNTEIAEIYAGSEKIWPDTPTGPSPADGVVARLPNLTPAEEDAVREFVDEVWGRGDWDNIIEIYCFALNELDSLTGWKNYTATIDRPADWTHDDIGWKTSLATTGANGINTNIVPSTEITNGFGYAGIWLHDIKTHLPDNNAALFGCTSSAETSIYCWHQGTDTEDAKFRFSTTREDIPTPNSYPWGDMKKRFTSVQYKTDGILTLYKDKEVVKDETRVVHRSAPTVDLYINGYSDGVGQYNCRQSHISFFILGKNNVGNFPAMHDNITKLLGKLGVPTTRTAADEVVTRLPHLSTAEETAVRKFVDSVDARGEWDLIVEIFCFSLNEDDSLTGFKSHTATVLTPGNWTHSVDGWLCSGSNSIDTTVNLANSMAGNFGSVGVFMHSMGYVGTGNIDLYGCVAGGVESYLRHRGNDTNDFNSRHIAASFISPRPSTAQADLALKFHTTSYASPDVHTYWQNGTLMGTANEVFAGIPSDSLYVNGRNNGGTQNARASGYSLFFVADEGISIPDFYNDVLTLLQDLGVSGV